MAEEMARRDLFSKEINEMIHRVRKMEEELHVICTGSNNRCRENGGHLLYWDCKCSENERIMSAMSSLASSCIKAMDAL